MHSGVPADRCVWYCVSLQRVGRRSMHTPTNAARARRRPPSPRSSSPPPTAASHVSRARVPPLTHRTLADSIDTSPSLRRISAGRRAQNEKEAKKPPSLAGRRPRGGPRGRPPRDFRSRRLGPQQRLQQCAASSGRGGSARWWPVHAWTDRRHRADCRRHCRARLHGFCAVCGRSCVV